VLKAYFKKIGGRPANPQAKGKKSKKRSAETTPPKRHGKKSKLSTPEAAPKTAVATSARKGKKSGIEDDWKPPGGTWENNVVDVDTIEEAWDSEQGEMVRFAYIMWDNGRKTRHMLPTLNQKCPQKVCIHPFQHNLSVTDM
jgi:chromobox protein 1